MHTIEILGAQGPMKMKDLAGKMGITTGTLTVAIDNLEKIDLVKRIPNPEDRRSIVIVLTENGQGHYQKHSQHHRDLTAEGVADLATEDIEKFYDLLRSITNKM